VLDETLGLNGQSAVELDSSCSCQCGLLGQIALEVIWLRRDTASKLIGRTEG
jgi:hypothetical protein